MVGALEDDPAGVARAGAHPAAEEAVVQISGREPLAIPMVDVLNRDDEELARVLAHVVSNVSDLLRTALRTGHGGLAALLVALVRVRLRA